MSGITISQKTRRRFILGKQGLWPGRRWRGTEGALAAARDMGAVQLDPIDWSPAGPEAGAQSPNAHHQRNLVRHSSGRKRRAASQCIRGRPRAILSIPRRERHQLHLDRAGALHPSCLPLFEASRNPRRYLNAAVESYIHRISNTPWLIERFEAYNRSRHVNILGLIRRRIHGGT